MNITYKPIGVIHTPFKKLEGMPIQPVGAQGIKGSVEVFQKYREGLTDLDGFSHVILIYHFHLSTGFKLRIIPFLDTAVRGLFATHAPRRPNPIGISVVKLLDVREGIIQIENPDMLDGTPLLDIKPYVPDFDAHTSVRTGWLEAAGEQTKHRTSDERFKTNGRNNIKHKN